MRIIPVFYKIQFTYDKIKKRNTSLESIPLALDLSDAMRLRFAPPQAYIKSI